MNKCPIVATKVDMTTLPRTMRTLPIDRGFPVPWFVAWVGGKPEFRAYSRKKFAIAVNQRRCWVCGCKLQASFCFVAGPMCGVNRTSSEPPSHPDCARWSAINCPFLSNPNAVRRQDEVMNNETLVADSPGIAITRNPGIAMLWFTKSYKIVPDGMGGKLIEMGAALAVEWWHKGKPATREQVQHSIDGGLPSLQAVAALQEGGIEELQLWVKRFEKLLP